MPYNSMLCLTLKTLLYYPTFLHLHGLEHSIFISNLPDLIDRLAQWHLQWSKNYFKNSQPIGIKQHASDAHLQHASTGKETNLVKSYLSILTVNIPDSYYTPTIAVGKHSILAKAQRSHNLIFKYGKNSYLQWPVDCRQTDLGPNKWQILSSINIIDIIKNPPKSATVTKYLNCRYSWHQRLTLTMVSCR